MALPCPPPPPPPPLPTPMVLNLQTAAFFESTIDKILLSRHYNKTIRLIGQVRSKEVAAK